MRVATRRWGLRRLVEAELARLGQLDALVESVLGTARAATRRQDGSGPLPMAIRDELSVIGAGLRRLATTEQPWPKVTLDVVRAITRRIVATARVEPADRAVVIGSLLHTSALDLAAVLGADRPATDAGRERLSGRTTGSNRGALPADR